MTNLQIVFDTAIAAQVFTEEEAATYLEKMGRLPLFTFKEWKARGYYVRRGEHAALVVALWMRKTGKKKVENPVMEDGAEDAPQHGGDYYLKTCYLFTPAQVERAKEA